MHLLNVISRASLLLSISITYSLTGFSQTELKQISSLEDLNSCDSLVILPVAVSAKKFVDSSGIFFTLDELEKSIKEDVQSSLGELLEKKYKTLVLDSTVLDSTFFTDLSVALKGKSKKSSKEIKIPESVIEKMDSHLGFRYFGLWVTEINWNYPSSKAQVILKPNGIGIASNSIEYRTKNSFLLIDKLNVEVVQFRTLDHSVSYEATFLSSDFLKLTKPVYYKKKLNCR